ncbi:MAG: diphosphomevalonate decarboxylase [Anaerolineales bacterium]|nr:diphosphomevalonate decarboxylase [Anaerolineales bacterium]
MTHKQAKAVAHANIAFIKYWGQRDPALNLPATPSISMNLDSFQTAMTVSFDSNIVADEMVINGDRDLGAAALPRVSAQLERVRARAGVTWKATVISRTNIPSGAGIASSAAAFAALTVAAAAALGLNLSEAELSALARRGSGSACRSVPAGFVEWVAGAGDDTSVAKSVAPPDHWALCDCVAIVSREAKAVGSQRGHELAPTSPLHGARVARALDRVSACRQAIAERNLAMLGQAMEQDAVTLHAIAMTSTPPVYYWIPATLGVIRAVQAWRAEGLPVYYTVDAGPNVHCLCEEPDALEVTRRLAALPGVLEVRTARPGGAARVV